MNDLGDDRKERDGRMGRDVMKKARERCFEIGRMMRNKTENEGREERKD